MFFLISEDHCLTLNLAHLLRPSPSQMTIWCLLECPAPPSEGPMDPCVFPKGILMELAVPL